MKKIVLAALAALFALSTPALASIVSGKSTIVQQDEGGQKPEGEGGGEGGGGGGGGGGGD
jgi:hypothetical protein